MFALAQELAAANRRVVVTTTTHIRPPTSEQAGALCLSEDADALRHDIDAAFEKTPIVCAAAGHTPDNKLRGLEPDVVCLLMGVADAILVEADGARGLSIKAPAEYEPVIPPCTHIVIPVVGMDALGAPLDSRIAHRPDRIATLTDTPPGTPITEDTITRLLTHPDGALKGVPPGAKVMPLLNKVEDESTLVAARAIARHLKNHHAISRVLLGSVSNPDPITEVWRKVGAVILAAGGSRRFGRPKQLLLYRGTTLLQHVIRVVCDAPLDQVVLVLGYGAMRIREALDLSALPYPADVIVNRRWAEGISTSIRVGLGVLRPEIDAALFILADYPGISTRLMEALLLAYYSSEYPIVAPTYRGQRGNPVLFDRLLFDELASLQGDIGGRTLIARYQDRTHLVEVEDDAILYDVDTLADYQQVMERWGK